MSANHEIELGPEEELREMFSNRRTDAASFREGVAKRIAEREDVPEESEVSQAPPMSLMRRVAAVFTVGPIPSGKAGSTSVKFMYATLALPALVLAATLGSFFVSVRSVRREMEDAVPTFGNLEGAGVFEAIRSVRAAARSRNRDLAIGGRLMTGVNMGSLITLVLSFLTGGELAMDMLTVVILVAMASLVLSVRGLATEGVLCRPVVIGVAMGLLMTVFGGCFIWFSSVLGIPDGHTEMGVGGASGVVMFGIVACLFAGWGWRRGLAGAFLMLGFVLALNPLCLTMSTSANLSSQLETTALDPRSLENWKGAAAVFTTLESIGSETPDMAPVARKVALAIEGEAKVHPAVWTAAARMGLISDLQWAQLVEQESHERTMERMLDPDPMYSLASWDGYRIRMLLATHELTADERSLVVSKVSRAWPDPAKHNSIGDALLLVEALDLLGRADLVEEKRDWIHSLLLSHWTAPGETRAFGNPGGFSPDPVKFRTSFADTTWTGVQLMSRVGVPEGIDLGWVRGNLKKEARGFPLVIELMPSLRLIPRAALSQLEEGIGLPAQGLLDRIVAERLLIATALLVALCLLAIRMAPTRSELMQEGAQP